MGQAIDQCAGEDGIISAPGNVGDINLAICTDTPLRDLEAQFDFVWDTVWTNAGFIFRASDAQHYYMVHFPVVGQHRRAEHFWAMVSVVDETGYAKVLDMLVHGVSSVSSIWHTAKVQAEGDRIRVWVDGRPALDVHDDQYPYAGYVGLATYGSAGGGPKSRFRNEHVSVRPTPL